MHTQVQLIGDRPTLFLDGQAVVRVDTGTHARPKRSLELRDLPANGYRTSLAPQEIARHLLKYAKGADQFPRHHCDADLRSRLEAVAKNADGFDWIAPTEAAALMGLALSTFYSMRSNGQLGALKWDGGGKGKPLFVRKDTIETWLQARRFASGLMPDAQVTPYRQASGFK